MIPCTSSYAFSLSFRDIWYSFPGNQHIHFLHAFQDPSLWDLVGFNPLRHPSASLRKVAWLLIALNFSVNHHVMNTDENAFDCRQKILHNDSRLQQLSVDDDLPSLATGRREQLQAFHIERSIMEGVIDAPGAAIQGASSHFYYLWTRVALLT